MSGRKLGPDTAAELRELVADARSSGDFTALYDRVGELRMAGFSYSSIAAPMDVTPQRARQMALRGRVS
ncbi:MAG: hypothetical protein ACREN2_05735 [Candidatus Dormibacteria bacterium]